jgi:hypothetical protein
MMSAGLEFFLAVHQLTRKDIPIQVIACPGMGLKSG